MSRSRPSTGRQKRSLIRRVIERDGCRCWLCGEPIDLTLDPSDDRARSLDHVRPFSQGGGHDLANLRLAHRVCNTMRDCTPVEAVA